MKPLFLFGEKLGLLHGNVDRKRSSVDFYAQYIVKVCIFAIKISLICQTI